MVYVLKGNLMNQEWIIWLVVLIGVAVGVAWLCIRWIQMQYLPKPEERYNPRQAQRLRVLYQQLTGVNAMFVKEKAPWIEQKSVAQLQQAILEQQITYTDLVAFYLLRIAEYDQSDDGLNAVSEINEAALLIARQKDQELAQMGDIPSPLFGMPVLVKENINTKGMPTSAGSVALKEFIPQEDAAVVNAVLEQGAIVLGKTNLSEMAHYMDWRMPSGYSSKNGQTHNPFGPLTLSPLGSSSGSAVALAADFTTLAIGTETAGSIVAPAAVNSVVGFKPSRNLVDSRGVLPLSSSLDTVGPMAKTVCDAVLLFNAMVPLAHQLSVPTDCYFLNEKRIGVLTATSDKHMIQQLQAALCTLGAIPVSVVFDERQLDLLALINQDMAQDFAAFAQQYQLPVQTLAELVAYNNQDRSVRAKYGQRLLAQASQTQQKDEQLVRAMLARAEQQLTSLFVQHQLDSLVFLNNEGSVLSCIGGVPELSVPFGTNQQGVPQGATFIHLCGQEQLLVNSAYAFEQGTQLRVIPQI